MSEKDIKKLVELAKKNLKKTVQKKRQWLN